MTTSKDLKTLNFNEFLELPENQKEWLLKVSKLDQLSPEEGTLEENINNLSVFYSKGDYIQKHFFMEAGFVIIDGNLKSEHVDTFEIVLLVTHDIITNDLTTGNESIDVWGNVNINSKLILGDIETTFTIKNNLIVDTIINSIPSEEDLQLSIGGKITGGNKVYVAENSYGQMGNMDVLKKLGFEKIEIMESEEWEKITSELY